MRSADQAAADTALASAAIAGFTAAYGRKPHVVWSAPGRANLIGEHTDYNEGLVLPFAIAERTVVAAALGAADGSASNSNADEVVVTSGLYPQTARARLAEVGPGVVPGWAGYPLGVAWALSQSPERTIPAAASLYIQSTVPSGAGLSSSAALEIAVACALNDLWGLRRTAPELARAGRKAENEIVGAPTGIMDQYASLLGQADSAVFLDCRTEEATVVPLRLRGAGLALVLIDTGERHSHAAGGYAARRASCERAARELGVPALRDVTPATCPRPPACLTRRPSAARGTSSPRTSGSPRRWRRWRRATWRPWGNCSPGRMPPCATTSRSPRPRLTSRWTSRCGKARLVPG